MKRCLIIKTSSLGDVIHMFPALTEAKKHIPEIIFDWVVEKSFADLCYWHPAVNNVIPVEVRKWRKNIFRYYKDIRYFNNTLKKYDYDYVIDAQGLMKSAFVAFCAKGDKYGFDKRSVREKFASYFYRHKVYVGKKQHAILRLKELVAKSLVYDCDYDNISYDLKYQWNKNNCENQVVFIHATTWATKHWSLSYWHDLAAKVSSMGINVLLPWGCDNEKNQAEIISQGLDNVTVLPKLGFDQLANLFIKSKAVISVDTGLSHMSGACNVPTLCLYGSTSSSLTGAVGSQSSYISSTLTCSPCLKRVCAISNDRYPPCQKSITVEKVYNTLKSILQ